MKTLWQWLKRNWKPVAGIACTAVAVGAVPINPVITGTVGAVCTAVLTKKSEDKK